MTKETVIVFDGEDKFIAPRKKVYDKNKGKSAFVNQVGDTKTPPPMGGDVVVRNLTPATTLRSRGGMAQMTAALPQVLRMPQVGEVDFCNKIQAFMRENTMSPNFSPEQQAIAQSLFQSNCFEKPTPPPTAPVSPKGGITPMPIEGDLPAPTQPQISSVSFPRFELLGCNDLDIEIASIENTLASNKFDALTKNIYTTALAKANAVKTQKCSPQATPSPSTPSPSTPTPPTSTPPTDAAKDLAVILPLGSPLIGLRPMGGGGFGGGGGAEEGGQVPTKKSNSLLWILLVIGGVYLLTRKKKK